MRSCFCYPMRDGARHAPAAEIITSSQQQYAMPIKEVNAELVEQFGLTLESLEAPDH